MKNIKFLIIFLFGVIIMISFTGCFNRNTELQKVGEEQQLGDNIQDSIIKFLAEQDIETLKSVLSENALNSEDLETGIEYCLELYQGELSDIEKGGCPVHGYFDCGKKAKVFTGNYILTMNNGIQYYLQFEYWLEQEIDSTKKGLDKLKIVNYKDYFGETKKQQYVGLDDYEQSGIYNPEWDKSQ